MYVDLKRAFDTISIPILLKKLEAYGCNEAFVRWISSYLTDRQQVVNVRGKMSQPMSLSVGVAQGSIGGPLLFNLFVNDVFSVTSHCKLALYADDTTALFSGDSVKAVVDMINDDVRKLAA